MRLIKLLKLYVVITIMVFTIALSTEQSFAFWASGVTGPAIGNTVGTIQTGAWQTIPQWDSNTSYLVGDQVINNGSIYQAKKNNPTREPGVSGGWKSDWTLIGPA